jgi:hypothetical protein
LTEIFFGLTKNKCHQSRKSKSRVAPAATIPRAASTYSQSPNPVFVNCLLALINVIVKIDCRAAGSIQTKRASFSHCCLQPDAGC